MTVKEAIETRRSVRSYSSKPVEEALLREVLEAGRLAPSASNQQKWKFILVRDPEKLAALYEASERQQSVKEAPAAIVAVATASYDMSCGERTAPVDTSIAFSFMLLRAQELGLGTCWLGHFFPEQVRAALAIPEDVEIVAVTPIGYPAETPEARPRLPFDEVVSYEKY
ncbi:MAG: nitroreductase family protein [Oscillospiraceae bacterium]|jgi:nitroreductase|nr:nitroreductase family protein [Oscillospiraceae bacterium]